MAMLSELVQTIEHHPRQAITRLGRPLGIPGPMYSDK